MQRIYFPFVYVWAMLVVACGVMAQSSPPRNRVAGSVASVDVNGKQLSVKTDQGEVVSVTASDTTLILRIPPGETDPKKGSKIPLSNLAAGDRVVASGAPSADSKVVAARSILVMTRSDVAQLQQKDHDDWKKRGSAGTVTAVDASARKVSIKVGARIVAVQADDKTDFRRYSPDSARFSDARPSSISDIQSGDQMRVLGNKSEDGSTIQAERIVFGSFRQLAATITSVNADAHELTVKDLASKKSLIIRADSDSTMRKLPEQAARMLARRYQPGAGSGEDPGVAGRGPGRGGRGGDVGQMLDSLPALPLSELKAGDAIMVSTTQGTDPSRVTAIMLLAGVEPLLTASPTATRDIMGGWNLGGGGEENQ